MDKNQKSFIENGPSFLMHYNHNHDKLGRFARSTLFVSGSSKTQNKDSEYYRRKLPKQVRKELKEAMRNGDKIIVGDAPGVDRQVQDYLKVKGYKDVEIYGPGKQVRYSANPDWKTNAIDSKHPECSKEWLAEKDKVMAKRADKGIAVILDEGSRATRNNIDRLSSEGKDVSVFQLSSEGKKQDRKVTDDETHSQWDWVSARSKDLVKDNLRYELKNHPSDLVDWKNAYEKGYLSTGTSISKKDLEKYRKEEAQYYLKYKKKYDKQVSYFVDNNRPAKNMQEYSTEEIYDYAYDDAVRDLIWSPVYDKKEK